MGRPMITVAKQQSLFAAPKAEDPLFNRKREVFRKLRDPFGQPDKSGNYFYERHHRKLLELSDYETSIVRSVERLPCDRLDAIMKILREWNNAKQFERDDFDASVGGE